MELEIYGINGDEMYAVSRDSKELFLVNYIGTNNVGFLKIKKLAFCEGYEDSLEELEKEHEFIRYEYDYDYSSNKM